MNLQRDVVDERLAKLREVVRTLRDIASVPRAEFVASERDRWAAERGLQLAAEAVFDVGSHILVSHFNDSPSAYEEILTRLARQGVLGDELHDHLEGLGGFRNILVHDYLDIDPARIHDYLQTKPDEFVDFAAEIEDFLDALEG